VQTRIETIAGETPGLDYHLVIHEFAGRSESAASAYLQAALHAGERPGVAALHYLMPMLAKAEEEGRLAGRVTVVPQANPVGMAQHLMGDHFGRFSLATRTNFNRDFPVPDEAGVTPWEGPEAPVFAERRLKSRLLEIAVDHALVLDLHCDDESAQYLYIPDALWPALADLAACLSCRAVLRWTGMPERAFEEAIYAHIRHQAGPDGDISHRCTTTVELRGQGDVDPDLAMADARGIYAFLVLRGVIEDETVSAPAPVADFVSVPITHVEMMQAPDGGTLLYHVRPGDRVKAGDLVAELLVRPGEPDGAIELRAPQDGLVLTRRMRRFVRRGDDVAKIVGVTRSATAKDGTLED
jgi:Predicted deacylase